MSKSQIKVLIVGAGNIGLSHALAYHKHPGYNIVGFVDTKTTELPELLKHYPMHTDYEIALKIFNPDLVSINTYSNTHAEYAKIALKAGKHVFVEEPWALSLKDATEVLSEAKKAGRQLLIGHILRFDPIWNRFVIEARNMDGPYVVRLAASQQSDRKKWKLHKTLMQSAPPLVDTGIHLAYIMCKIIGEKPIKINAIGQRLSEELEPKIYNYGQMQLTFTDGSIGWIETGWGPMMSRAGALLRDVVSPSGSVSVVSNEYDSSNSLSDQNRDSSAIIVRHTKPMQTQFEHKDWDPYVETRLPFNGKMSQDLLCEREQAYVHKAIVENIDLSEHHHDALQSLEICLAAHKSVSTGKTVQL